MLNLFKRDSFDDLESYDEEEKIEEPQIIETFNYDDPQIMDTVSNEEDEDYEDYIEKKQKKYYKYKKIINISFIIIVLILTMITVDVIGVSRYNVGPFFAIKTKTYKDGGSKEYYGIGYKVIKYNQKQGRRDKEIGFWNLTYNTTPIDTSDVDLAIEFEGNYEATSKKYYKKFVRLKSTVKSVNTKKNELLLQFRDDSKKYTLDIICNMAKKDSNLGQFNKKDSVYLIGTISKFKVKTKSQNNKLYIDNCFAQSNSKAEVEEIK